MVHIQVTWCKQWEFHHTAHSCAEYVLIEKKLAKETNHKFIKYDLKITDFDENINIMKSPFSAI